MSNILIKSNGTACGTQVFAGDTEITDITEIEIKKILPGEMVSAIITLCHVNLEIVAESETYPKKLTAPGQIRIGDTIFCNDDGKPRKFKAKEILKPGTPQEEIITDDSKRKYIITSRAIKGDGWAKNVRFKR